VQVEIGKLQPLAVSLLGVGGMLMQKDDITSVVADEKDAQQWSTREYSWAAIRRVHFCSAYHGIVLELACDRAQRIIYCMGNESELVCV
jgi:hypothetical protein